MSVPASKVPLPQTPMPHVVFLIVANQANSDDNLADISMALAKTGKAPGTFAHLDSLPVQVGPQVLKPLNAPNKQLILLGHVGNHSMGGHTCSALADMLVQKGLPQDSKHPIPILVLGCQPSKQGLQGLENIGAELLMELTKRRVNATTLSFDPSTITYTTDTDPRESKEWITTYLSHSLSAKGITWVFSGIPQCYREIKERLELDLQACRTKTTALTAESEHNKALIRAKETELSALQGDLNSVTSKIQALELEKQQIWREARTIQDRIAGGKLQASVPTPMPTSTAVVLAGLQPSSAPLSLPQENTEASLKLRYETLRQRVAAINLETAELKKREQEITHLITKIPGDLHDLNKVLTSTTQKIKTAETQIKDILKDIDSLYVEMREAMDPFELATVQYAQPQPKLLSATEQLAEPLIRERYLDTQIEARPLQEQEKRIVVPENPLQGSYTPPDASI